MPSASWESSKGTSSFSAKGWYLEQEVWPAADIESGVKLVMKYLFFEDRLRQAQIQDGSQLLLLQAVRSAQAEWDQMSDKGRRPYFAFVEPKELRCSCDEYPAVNLVAKYLFFEERLSRIKTFVGVPNPLSMACENEEVGKVSHESEQPSLNENRSQKVGPINAHETNVWTSDNGGLAREAEPALNDDPNQSGHNFHFAIPHSQAESVKGDATAGGEKRPHDETDLAVCTGACAPNRKSLKHGKKDEDEKDGNMDIEDLEKTGQENENGNQAAATQPSEDSIVQALTAEKQSAQRCHENKRKVGSSQKQRVAVVDVPPKAQTKLAAKRQVPRRKTFKSALVEQDATHLPTSLDCQSDVQTEESDLHSHQKAQEQPPTAVSGQDEFVRSEPNKARRLTTTPRKVKRRKDTHEVQISPKSERRTPAVIKTPFKRAPTAYTFYSTSKEERDTIKFEHPNATFAKIGKLLAERWRGMPFMEKKRYFELSATTKKKLEAERQPLENPASKRAPRRKTQRVEEDAAFSALRMLSSVISSAEEDNVEGEDFPPGDKSDGIPPLVLAGVFSVFQEVGMMLNARGGATADEVHVPLQSAVDNCEVDPS